MSGGDSGAPRRVHQLLAALSYGDAISNEALAIQGHLRAAGFASDIFAEKVHPRMAHLARPLWEYRERVRQAPAASASSTSPSAAPPGAWRSTPPTPSWPSTTTSRRPTSSSGFHPHLAGLCHHGRRELEAFAPRTALALGDSEYNRRELEAAGFERTGVLPIVLDLAKYDRPASRGRPPPLRRRAHQRPLRGPDHPQQEDRGPGPDLRRLPAVGGAPQPAAPRGRHPGLRALLRSAPGAGERAAGGRGGLHRAGGRRRAPRLLPRGRRLPLPLGARGVLRPVAGGHALRGAGGGLRRGGGPGDAPRRRGSPPRQGPDGGGGAPGAAGEGGPPAPGGPREPGAGDGRHPLHRLRGAPPGAAAPGSRGRAGRREERPPREDRPVGSHPPSGGRHRRLGAAHARRVPLMGAHRRRLRAGARPRPRGGRPLASRTGARAVRTTW